MRISQKLGIDLRGASTIVFMGHIFLFYIWKVPCTSKKFLEWQVGNSIHTWQTHMDTDNVLRSLTTYY